MPWQRLASPNSAMQAEYCEPLHEFAQALYQPLQLAACTGVREYAARVTAMTATARSLDASRVDVRDMSFLLIECGVRHPWRREAAAPPAGPGSPGPGPPGRAPACPSRRGRGARAG